MVGKHNIKCSHHFDFPTVTNICINFHPTNNDNRNELKSSCFEMYASIDLYYVFQHVLRQHDNEFSENISQERVCQATKSDAKLTSSSHMEPHFVLFAID